MEVKTALAEVENGAMDGIRLRPIAAALALCAIAWTAGFGQAPASDLQLTGAIHDTAGGSVAGARIRVRGAETVSDQSGRYALFVERGLSRS